MPSLPIEVWGIVNVTPDSFSGGTSEPAEATALALEMVDAGASVIDIGGQSTRPKGPRYGQGAIQLSAAEEWARIETVVRALVDKKVTVSVDTFRFEVAQKAVDAGARIINDVSCAADRRMLELVAQHGVDYVLMHNREDGRIEPPMTTYSDVVADVIQELEIALKVAHAFGIKPGHIWLDPGIGFAKTSTQSLVLLANLEKLVDTGHKVLLGASRKSWMTAAVPHQGGSGAVDGHQPTHRLGGSVAAACWGASQGVRAVRVHDVSETVQALQVWQTFATHRNTT